MCRESTILSVLLAIPCFKRYHLQAYPSKREALNNVGLMLGHVADGGTAANQHWFIVSFYDEQPHSNHDASTQCLINFDLPSSQCLIDVGPPYPTLAQH